MKQLSLIGIVCSIKFVVNAHADRKNRTASDSETRKKRFEIINIKSICNFDLLDIQIKSYTHQNQPNIVTHSGCLRVLSQLLPPGFFEITSIMTKAFLTLSTHFGETALKSCQNNLFLDDLLKSKKKDQKELVFPELYK